ncbi:hypothetical protein ABDK09_12185 [Vibrio sp. CDRSL-10 TSBA]
MGSWFKFEWVFISWIISLFIHHHSIKRSAISSKKDELVDLLTSLSDFKWLEKEDGPLYQEERYNAKIARISWKIKQLNQLSSCKFIDEGEITPLYGFDVESYLADDTSPENRSKLKFSLQETCEDIVDKIENAHFEKVVTSKGYILWSARHSIFGVLTGLLIVYLFIEIMSFFFK